MPGKFAFYWRLAMGSLLDFLFYLPWGGEKLFRNRTVAFARLQSGEEVLDSGCGFGKLIPYILPHIAPGGRIAGTDISASSLAIAARRLPHRSVTFHKAPAGELPFPDSSFDKCFISLALHHMSPRDRQAALREVGRVLKKGGSLTVAEYNLPDRGPARLAVLIIARLDTSAEAYKMLARDSLIAEMELVGLVVTRREVICRGLFQLVAATPAAK